MTRLLLPGIGVAILMLGSPRATSAAELLRPGGESTRVVPRPDRPSKGALARDRSRTAGVQVAHVTPFAPTAAPRLPRALVRRAEQPEAPLRSAPASRPHVLPDARAPPA